MLYMYILDSIYSFHVLVPPHDVDILKPNVVNRKSESSCFIRNRRKNIYMQNSIMDNIIFIIRISDIEYLPNAYSSMFAIKLLSIQKITAAKSIYKKSSIALPEVCKGIACIEYATIIPFPLIIGQRPRSKMRILLLSPDAPGCPSTGDSRKGSVIVHFLQHFLRSI